MGEMYQNRSSFAVPSFLPVQDTRTSETDQPSRYTFVQAKCSCVFLPVTESIGGTSQKRNLIYSSVKTLSMAFQRACRSPSSTAFGGFFIASLPEIRISWRRMKGKPFPQNA